MPPPKAAKGEYIETVSKSPNISLSIHTKSPNPPKTKNPNLTTKKTGHRKQNLPPIPNPWHTTYHPRRENSNPSRSRNPRRPIPHRNTPSQRPQQSSRTSSRKPQHAQRGDNSWTIQLHLQERDPTPAEPTTPRHPLVLPAQDRRPCFCRRGCCC